MEIPPPNGNHKHNLRIRKDGGVIHGRCCLHYRVVKWHKNYWVDSNKTTSLFFQLVHTHRIFLRCPCRYYSVFLPAVVMQTSSRGENKGFMHRSTWSERQQVGLFLSGWMVEEQQQDVTEVYLPLCLQIDDHSEVFHGRLFTRLYLRLFAQLQLELWFWGQQTQGEFRRGVKRQRVKGRLKTSQCPLLAAKLLFLTFLSSQNIETKTLRKTTFMY